jgi:hypothetical protein
MKSSIKMQFFIDKIIFSNFKPNCLQFYLENNQKKYDSQKTIELWL